MNALQLMELRRTPLRMVIFDCDGVLVDSEPISNRVLAEEITALGWPLTTEETKARFIGATLTAIRGAVETKLGRPLPANWESTFVETLARVMARECRPMVGAIKALRATTTLGLPWRVASNSSHREMAVKFAAAGMADLVAGRINSFEDVTRGKPAPDLFLHAAAAEGVAPQNCVVVEDSLAGVQAARAAGMDCLGLASSMDPEALRAVGAAPFRSMTELPGLLATGLRQAA